MDIQQLVQDVHDEKESALKAWDILFAQLIEINRCMEEIYPAVQSERSKK